MWKNSKREQELVDINTPKKQKTERLRNKWEKGKDVDEEEWEDIKDPEKPRKYTISIAVPVTILEETCIKDELRTYVVGQIARAATIYSVDEIIVYNDHCWRKRNNVGNPNAIKDLIDMMRILLEYQECPQYLRKHFFEYDQHLRCVGVLNALNAPHHLRSNQWCQYREGVVLDKGKETSSLVDVGLSSDILVDKQVKPGLRVTVKLPQVAREMKRPYGELVSPSEPRELAGHYWGYTVRVANSLTEVLTGGDFSDGYDLLIGTSDKGQDVKKTSFPSFSHALIIFGGVEGLEAAIEADEELEATEPLHLFDHYINTCPNQQSRTIRTEEAILISLTSLYEHLAAKGQ